MNTNKITNFLFEMASLRRLTRSHRQVIQDVNDNISDHSFRVAIIGMILANVEKVDENKVMKICLLHDIAEARTGDANYINKQYITKDEESAVKDQSRGLPVEKELISLINEYHERITKEAILAKDADNLDQMILQQEYFYKDKINAKIWHRHTENMLKTKSAKKIAKSIKKTNPFEWLYQLAEHKTGKKIKR